MDDVLSHLLNLFASLIIGDMSALNKVVLAVNVPVNVETRLCK